MSVNRTASSLPPLFLRATARSARRHPHSLPRTLPAIALLVPRRDYAPEPTTESNGGQHNFPPPGFNTEAAKRPAPQREKKAQSPEAKEAGAADSSASLHPNESPANAAEATSHPKTDAAEQQTLTELAAQKSSEDKHEETKIAKKKEENKKLTVWQKVKKEAHHYWDGTKLLASEVRISSKLALKMAAGYELSRREHRQVSRQPLHHPTLQPVTASYSH